MGCPAKNSAQRDAVRLLLSTLLALVLITGAAAVGFAPFRPGQTEFFGSPPVLTDSVRVNINEADVSELCCLPEVGISRAEAIITYRQLQKVVPIIQHLMHIPLSYSMVQNYLLAQSVQKSLVI